MDSFPMLLIPRKCTNLDAICDTAGVLVLEIKITSPDEVGNETGIYSGYCNIKVIDNYDLNMNHQNSNSQTSDLKDNSEIAQIEITVGECNQDSLNQSDVWIDPTKIPYVYNNCDTMDSNSETLPSDITLEQHNTYIAQNMYNEHVQYLSNEDLGHRKYIDDEFECGILLSQMSEDIITERENRAREELMFLNHYQTDHDALQQLMSSDIQSSSKQQKTIMYLGNDSDYGQTVQSIAVNDPSLECYNVSNEVIVESTQSNHKKYQCDKCKQFFDQIQTFRQHMVNSHKSPKVSSRRNPTREMKYTCKECGKHLKSLLKLEHHRLGHGNPDLECPKCLKVFASKFTLKNHLKIHQRKFPCPHCPKAYNTSEELRSHQAKVHFILMCELCDYTTKIYADLVEHKQTHTKTVELSGFNKTQSRNSDIISDSGILLTSNEDFIIASDESDQQSDEIRKADSVIAKVMSNQMFLNQNQKGRRYKTYNKTCDVCLKTFDRISDLKRHLIEHVIRSTLAKTPINQTGGLTIQCGVCQVANFTEIVKYKAHLREHAKLTLYKCTFCDRSFSDSSNFSKHKKIHGTTFFQCDLCQRKFNSRKMIAQHMEFHRNNPPLPCPNCGKEFHFLSMLNKHIQGVHERRKIRFRCKFCHEYFDTLREKWDHEWEKHKCRKQIVDCLLCESKFRKYSELKRHCVALHSMGIPPVKRVGHNKRRLILK